MVVSNETSVAHLAAALHVERGTGQDNFYFVAFLGLGDDPSIFE